MPGVRWEMLTGRLSPGTAWCVECDAAADEGSHEQCLADMDCSLWTPCLTCLGGGVPAGGGACVDCRGLGFWRADSEVAMFGGYTVLAQMYHEMATEDRRKGLLTEEQYQAEVSVHRVQPAKPHRSAACLRDVA